MQETIKFTLGAKLAIIKKPDSNQTYYTYSLPHKIILLGMLGAIIGLNGYNSENFIRNMKKEKEKLPDFYTKLNNLKIAIIPKFEDKGFSKKIQKFNNSVGYASKEEGNNLIVTEQLLENPAWDIYILEDGSEEYKKIKDYLMNQKCEYIPYIGKNDFFANILDVKLLDASLVETTSKIDSIFSEDIIVEKIKDYMKVLAFSDNSNIEYEFSEMLPTKLHLKLGYIEYKNFLYTNKEVKIAENTQIYDVDGMKIFYF